MSGNRVAIAAALTAILALLFVFLPGASIHERSADRVDGGRESPGGLPAAPPANTPKSHPSSAVIPPTSPTPQSAPPFSNLIDNGDFESYYPQSRPRLWRLDPETLFLWDEFSRGPGDRSLFIDASLLGQPGARLFEDNRAASAERANATDKNKEFIQPPAATLRYPLPALQPGASYILSLWLARDHNIDGVYPTVSLGGQSYRLSDFWTSGRWQRISLAISLPRMLPPGERRLELSIPPGDYRLWIDDIVLRRIEPLARTREEKAGKWATVKREEATGRDLDHSDQGEAPQNDRGGTPEGKAGGAGGNTLSWRLPSTDRLLDIRLVFSRDRYGRRDRREVRTNNAGVTSAERSQAAGSVGDTQMAATTLSDNSVVSESKENAAPGFVRAVALRKAITDPLPPIQRPIDQKQFDPSAAGVDDFSLPLDSLDLAGRWFARVEVYQHRKLLAQSKALPFKIRGSKADLAASRTAPNGSPGLPPETGDAPAAVTPPPSLLDSFPIGIYGARPEDFAALRDAGFNAAHVSVRDPAALSRALADASRYGLTLLISPPPASWLTLPPSSPSSPPSPSPLASRLASAPVYFYLADEPEGRSVSPKLLFLSRASLRRLGFPQPGAIALLRSWRAPDYASAVDIFMSDPYPVPFEPLSWMAECLDEIGRTVAGDPAKRVWAVIQAFPWGAAHPKIDPQLGRVPVPAEIRALVRLALLHGADGLFFYSLKSGDFSLRQNAALWDAVKEAIAEARILKPLLDAPALSPAPTIYCPAKDAYGLSAVHFKAVRPSSGPPLLLALNTLDRPVQAAIHLPGRREPVPFALEPLGFDKIELR